MKTLSIIIPIFKVRNFIERCACSLFEQTLKEIEYIFVNDATPDDTIEILKLCVERYPERKEQVRILTHEQNQGLPAARNTGLAVATGEYVFHCDSDDFVEKDMWEEMYHAELSKNNIVEIATRYLIKGGLQNTQQIQMCSGFTIYPVDYFCPIDYKTRELCITNNTRTIHHFAESWVPRSTRFKNALGRIFGAEFMSMLVKIKKNISH